MAQAHETRPPPRRMTGRRRRMGEHHPAGTTPVYAPVRSQSAAEFATPSGNRYTQRCDLRFPRAANAANGYKRAERSSRSTTTFRHTGPYTRRFARRNIADDTTRAVIAPDCGAGGFVGVAAECSTELRLVAAYFRLEESASPGRPETQNGRTDREAKHNQCVKSIRRVIRPAIVTGTLAALIATADTPTVVPLGCGITWTRTGGVFIYIPDCSHQSSPAQPSPNGPPSGNNTGPQQEPPAAN